MENTLREILRVVEPLPEDRQIRWQILQDLQRAVQSVESLRDATVEPFGSFVSDLFNRWGDLDVSIEFSKGSYICSYGKKHTLDVLKALMKAMRQNGGWNKYQFISHARVPILMVKSNYGNISCDISVDNLKAQMKSKLLLWIKEIDPRFRDMILLVKEWAKTHNINNSKSGSFNSYSLSMLLVFHFQTCTPAILPPLKDIYPDTLTDDLKGLRDDAETRIEKTCADNITRFKFDRFRAWNKSSLSELFISFLAKFSDISSKAVGLGICTYSGKWEAVESNMGWLPKTYCLLVEDPFDRPENTARGVSQKQLKRISEVFEMSHDMLISARYNPSIIESSLLATLVRPHMLHLLRNPNANFKGQQATHPRHPMAESSHSRTSRNYNGPTTSLNPIPTGPYDRQLVRSSPKDHKGLLVPTGPRVWQSTSSSPQVQPQLRQPLYSSSQGQPQLRQPAHLSSQVPSRGYKSANSPSQVPTSVHTSSLVQLQVQKPVHSSSQVQRQVRKPVHSSSQVQRQVRKPVPSSSQSQWPVSGYQHWRPKNQE